MSQKPHSRYRIVRPQEDRKRTPWLGLGLLWVLSLAATWAWASHRAGPELPALRQALGDARAQLRASQAALATFRQREATLQRSDQISRVANKEVQRALADREEELADLRGDVAFYERLVGSTAPPKGLNVHSAEFVAEAGGTWSYLVVLTQNLNRGVVSAGQMRFVVEGVRDGKLATIGWNELHQQPTSPAQSYSFRYFQRLKGSVMLPPGFTPQRVRVSLRGNGASIDQDIAWNHNTANGET